MARKMYGSVVNRLCENPKTTPEIVVGMGMTEYLWSDRHAYEVVEVKDQKHVSVREYDHKKKDDIGFSNNWELISNPNNPIRQMTKRGNYWYWTVVVTDEILKNLESDDVEQRIMTSMFLCNNNIEIDDLREKKKVTRYRKVNVSFGHADYYYDYEF